MSTPQDTARAVIDAVTSAIPKGSSNADHRDHHLAAIKQLVCAVMSQTMDARAIRFAVDDAIQVGIMVNATIRERRNG